MKDKKKKKKKKKKNIKMQNLKFFFNNFCVTKILKTKNLNF